jgi:hypothetical protein
MDAQVLAWLRRIMNHRLGVYRTPHVGQHDWVSIDGNAKQMDCKAIEEVVVDTYRATAPKKLLKERDG